jgi:hypothetical protein
MLFGVGSSFGNTKNLFPTLMKTQKVSTVAMIIALGGFLFGYDIAMISGTTSQ